LNPLERVSNRGKVLGTKKKNGITGTVPIHKVNQGGNYVGGVEVLKQKKFGLGEHSYCAWNSAEVGKIGGWCEKTMTELLVMRTNKMKSKPRHKPGRKKDETVVLYWRGTSNKYGAQRGARKRLESTKEDQKVGKNSSKACVKKKRTPSNG